MLTLTVALPFVRPTVATEFSYVLSADGRTVASHGSAAVALLPAAATVVLAVPARLVSWHAVKLPPVVPSRLRAALEGALEDILLDDPADLAFAVGGSRAADGSATVAVCDKAWLRAVLEFFEQANRPATRIVPEFAPATGLSERAMVVTGTAESPTLVLCGMQHVLFAPLAAATALVDHAGGDIPCAAEPAVAELAEQMLGRAVSILTPADRLLASGQNGWDLAQFDLAISGRGRLVRRGAQVWQQFAAAPSWRPVRWGLVLLLVANLVGLNAWAWKQDTAVQARREQNKGLLTQTFPKVRTIVDAPLQMEREVALLRQSSGALSGRDLEAMLAAVSGALPAGHNATGIDYAAGELVLKGLGLNNQQATQLTGRLAAQSMVARLEGDRLIVRAGANP